MNIVDLAILKKMVAGGGGSGTDNYNDLSNLPQINGETLAGNKTAENLGLQDEITNENKLDADLVDDAESTNKFVTAQEKETWNAKQNAIDSSHKLSSDLVDDTNHTNKFVTSQEKETWNAKQNAIDDLSTIRSGATAGATAVQPAELNNYVPNSSLVEVVDNGAKNYCPVNSGTLSAAGYLFQESVNLKAGTYVISWGTDTSTGSSVMDFFNASGTRVAQKGFNNSTSISRTEITLSEDVVSIGLYGNTACTYRNILITTKSQFGISPTYEPYALGNQVLTPALIEQVDSGAKNQLNLNGTQTSVYGLTVTWDYANGTVKVNGTVTETTDPAAYIHLGSWTAPADGYYKLYAENASAYDIYVYNDAAWGTSPGSAYDSVRYFSKGTSFGHIYLRVTKGYTVNNVTVKPMICTIEDWNVSQKHVPYRPDWNLVSKYALGGGFVSSGYKSAVANADLNAISESGFALYNSPSNMPSGTSGYCFVRTAYFDIQAIFQELVLLSTGVSYVRTKYGSTWNTWKQTSNA